MKVKFQHYIKGDGIKPLPENSSLWSDLKTYILQTNSNLAENNDKEIDLRIIFLRMKDIQKKEIYASEKRGDLFGHLSKLEPFCPTICIALENIMYRKENDFPELKKRVHVALNFARQMRFLDSSIWNYYIPFDNNFTTEFEQVITEIKANYEINLYNTIVAREFLEFQNRLLANSYLKNIGEGHASQISPFKFHSERNMKRIADKKLEKLRTVTQEKIEWNFLLLDDYAKKELRVIKGEAKNKLEIIKKHIQKKEGKSQLSFDATETVSEAVEMLNTKIYDVILLDYLLGESEGRHSSMKRAYGHELLLKILHPRNDDEKKLMPNRGPLEKYWIFPVSVFSSAMFDRLREKGIQYFSDNWILARGADPINTPHLFRYYLFSLLENQLSQVLFTIKDIIKFLKQNPVIRVGEKKDEQRKDDEIRLWAKSVFGAFIHRFGKREVIELDKDRNSVFADSVYKYLHDNPGMEFRFYDHVRQLLYLLAYGSGFHATQMWELSNFVEYEIFENNPDKEYDEPFIKTFKHYIPNYITNLTELNS